MKILLSAVVAIALLLGSDHEQLVPMPVRFAMVLQNFVDDDGLVDYAGLKGSGEANSMAEEVSGVKASGYDSLPERDRIAFWLNAYNAFTLKLIVDHYPIQPSTGKNKYPANSIRQIPGAWEHKKFKALGREVTLDEIEHKILRAEFSEPRIHMALVCAAVSCPKLRRELYSGAQLDAQLDDQARVFLSDLTKFHIDREANEVWASPIFDWFAGDFLPGATKDNPRHVAQEKALAAFAAKYVSPEDARYLEAGNYTVKFFEYDWTLNEQPK